MKPIESKIITGVVAMKQWSGAMRRSGRRIALVPTMGALHTGHLSLVQAAHQNADRIVVSIFVNPTQFGAGEDLSRYPRDFEGDVRKLKSVGADVVFAPQSDEMYADGNATWVDVERLGEGMCGRSRPGHFRGVTTIVARLLNVVRPHVAIFGEKDYQQFLLIRRMVSDLMMDVEIIGAPTVREPDGLAMSSRNAFLRPEARQQAAALNAALHDVRQLYRSGVREARSLVYAARRRIRKEPQAEIEYIEVRDAETLEPLLHVGDRAVMGVAVRFEGTRLIDNTVLEVEA